ncbi:hypothetical protein DH2020_045837 [Rehmannia glutinosa]|uniref:Proteasome alpha-type subunits domain-containing protein n=1 Tax=Rehmannia glutinosa TaxID=99300 RepID=A0ABR0UDQ7_REHGL
MSSIGTGYDLSVTTFSPDGRVFQIEYAAKAVDNSGTVVAIRCKDGVVMGVEKLIASKMMLPGSNRRIHAVHRHSGMKMIFDLGTESSVIDLKRGNFVLHYWESLAECFSCDLKQCWGFHDREPNALKKLLGKIKVPKTDSLKQVFSHQSDDKGVAGLAADGRQIVARAKSEATNYERFLFCSCLVCFLLFFLGDGEGGGVYGEPIPVKELAQRVASYVHLCTLYWWLRPFGCGVILGGYDRDGPQLYMVEPSGVSYRYFGAAIGKGRQAAKTEIEKLMLSEMTCRQGVVEVAKIIYGVHDEAKDKAFELEMSWVCDESNRQHQKVPDELLEEAKSAAKAALEEMDAD